MRCVRLIEGNSYMWPKVQYRLQCNPHFSWNPQCTSMCMFTNCLDCGMHLDIQDVHRTHSWSVHVTVQQNWEWYLSYTASQMGGGSWNESASCSKMVRNEIPELQCFPSPISSALLHLFVFPWYSPVHNMEKSLTDTVMNLWVQVCKMFPSHF